MSKIFTTSPSKTVRIVIKLNPYAAEKVRQIPAKKRSKFIEEAVMQKIGNENREYAWQNMLTVRNSIKTPVTMQEIVENLQKDRQSH